MEKQVLDNFRYERKFISSAKYDGYLDKLTRLPVPMEHPRQVDKNNFTYDISNLL